MGEFLAKGSEADLDSLLEAARRVRWWAVGVWAAASGRGPSRARLAGANGVGPSPLLPEGTPVWVRVDNAFKGPLRDLDLHHPPCQKLLAN